MADKVNGKYTTIAIATDFDIESTVSLPAGKFVKIAERVVQAQQINRFGSSAIVGGVDDRGTFKLAVKDASGNTIAGFARLVVSDANEINRQFIIERRSTQLSSGVPLEERKPGAGENSKLMIEFKADSADTMSEAQTTMEVPLTVLTLAKN